MSMKSALKDAGTLLARRDKIAKAIGREVSKLGELVERLAAAELRARDIAGRKLLGEATQSENDDGERELRTCRAEIEVSTQDLGALRMQLHGLAPALMERYRALEAEVPAHNAAIEEEFRREWDKAIANFSAALAKRALVEDSIGRKLQLTEPNAASASASAGDSGTPRKTMEELRVKMQSLSAAPSPRNPAFASILKPYDPRKVYVLRKPFQDSSGPLLPAGTKVIEAMLEPGWLDHVVSLDNAFPMEPAAADRAEIRQGLADIDRVELAAKRARERAEELAHYPEPPPPGDPVNVPALNSPYMDVHSTGGPSQAQPVRW